MSSILENDASVFHSPSPPTAPPSGSGDSPSCSSTASPLRHTTSSKRQYTHVEEVSSVNHVGRSKRRKFKTRVFEIAAYEPARRVNSSARFVHGNGLKLADVPNIAYSLDKCTAKDPHIELLHRVLFNCAGQATKRKATIRGFNGFVFRAEKERSQVRSKLIRAHLQLVKKVANLLDVDPTETKEGTSDAIMHFLEEPKIVEGRGNKSERERLQRQEKKRAERERAAKRKAELVQKQREGMVDSDSDGEEDLEFAALSWIEFAQVRRKQCMSNESDDKCPTNKEAQSNGDAVVAKSSPTAVQN